MKQKIWVFKLHLCNYFTLPSQTAANTDATSVMLWTESDNLVVDLWTKSNFFASVLSSTRFKSGTSCDDRRLERQTDFVVMTKSLSKSLWCCPSVSTSVFPFSTCSAIVPLPTHKIPPCPHYPHPSILPSPSPLTPAPHTPHHTYYVQTHTCTHLFTKKPVPPPSPPLYTHPLYLPFHPTPSQPPNP